MALGGTAFAQTPMGAPEETPVEEGGEEGEANTTAAATNESEEGSEIPGAAIGIGIGWVFPSDLTIPNTASARFRMQSGMTFEALLNLSFDTDSSETTVDGMTTDETSDSTTTVLVGASVRYPLATRGRFQFVGVGSAAVGFGSTSAENMGMDLGSQTSLTAGIGWGIGIDYFVRPHWSISLTAGNPLVQWQMVTQESGTVETTDSSLLIGAIWDPTISAMVHLYY